MNRRDILKLGVAGLGAAFATEAEAAPGEDVAGAVARLRRRLDRTRALDLGILRVPDGLTPAARERAEIDATLIRSSMRALLVAGSVMDLDEEARGHADLQQLLAEMSPEIDHAVHGSLLRLQTLPRADRRRVSAELQRNPAILEDVAHEIEHLAGKGGASVQRRFHLRSLLQQVMWRLTHQPLDAVLADTLEKTQAQAARMPDAPAPAREGPWAAATVRVSRAFVSDGDDAGYGREPSDRGSETRSQRLVRYAGTEAAIAGALAVAGLVLLGIGASSGNLAVTIGSLFILTPAVVGLILSLVTLIVAAVVAADEGASVEPTGRHDTAWIVVASGDWVRVGYLLQTDASYVLRAASEGPVTHRAGGDPRVVASDDAPAPGFPHGAVMARIGASVLALEDELLLSHVAGTLELAVNEPASASPKRFRVTITQA